MREASTTVLVAAFVVLAAVGFGGGAVTYAQMTDTETAEVSAQLAQCDIQLDSNGVTAPGSVAAGDTATIEASVTNNGQLDNCPEEATFNATGTTSGTVDIALLVDTSGSTEPYIDQIATKLGDFATALDNQGIDARFAVISYGGGGYVDINQGYTSSSSDTEATLNSLSSNGGTERNYRAIEVALNDLQPRNNAKKFVIDVTDEDNDHESTDCGFFCSNPDPYQNEIANQIDNAGATFIAVSPEQDELRNPEWFDPTPSEDIRVLAQDEVSNGFWVNLFTDDENDDSNNLNDFAAGFQDIVIGESTKTFSDTQPITLDGGQSDTVQFNVDTTGLTPTTPLNYEVTVAGDTQSGTIDITAPPGPLTFGASSIDSSPANGKRIVPEIYESSTEDAPNGTSPEQTPPENGTNATQTPPTKNETETGTATETPTTNSTTETTETETTTPTPTPTPTQTTTETSSTPTETETPEDETQTPTPTPTETTTTTAETIQTTSTTPASTSEETTADADSKTTKNGTQTTTTTAKPPETTNTTSTGKNETGANS